MEEEGRGNWLRVWLDGEPTDFIARGTSGGWSLHAIAGSESTFDWPTLDRILAWLHSSPPPYAFQAFPSGIQDQGETVLSVVALGILQEGMFFGYQGFESF